MQLKSKNLTLIVIIVLALLLIGYLWYTTVARDVPASNVVVVPADLLENNQAKEIGKMQVYGNVPVSVSAVEVGKPDPFAGI